MDWLMATLAAIGAIANVKKKWWGFLLWIITNSYWVAYNAHRGEYALSFQFAVFLSVVVWGCCQWWHEK